MKSAKPEKAYPLLGAPPIVFWSAMGLLTVIVLATYWSSLVILVGQWWNNPDYTYGFLVPAFAAFLLWYRRAMLQGVQLKGSAWGLLLVAVAGLMRAISSYYYYTLLDPASLVPLLAGLVIFIGGWNAFRWAWPTVLFLIFMVPLPSFLATMLGQPLQRFATIASTYIIQTLGISAVAEGNTIALSDSQIGVAEACNGLRNMMLFLTVCVGMSFIIRRSAIEKAIIVASAAGIALVANLIRIVVTAILYTAINNQVAMHFYHDWIGFFMMPLAVVLLWIELAYLRHVFVPVEDDELQDA